MLLFSGCKDTNKIQIAKAKCKIHQKIVQKSVSVSKNCRYWAWSVQNRFFFTIFVKN